MKFKTLDKQVNINGKDIPVRVTISVEEDYDIDVRGDYSSGDKAQDAAYFARFDRGELFVGIIRVEASALGETGLDVLGACHLHANSMFNHKPFTDDVEQLVETHDMIATALTDLASQIKQRAKELAPYVEESA